jgi:hypothetical protein
MKQSQRKNPSNNPEQAWFTGHFEVSFGDEETPRTLRLYAYPGKNSLYPADIRYANDDDATETVFEGRISFTNGTIQFQEPVNAEQSSNTQWVSTLAAVKAKDGLYVGGPETESGLFEPELALKIAQMEPKSLDTPEGRALSAQVRTLLKRGTPVTISVEQNDIGHATVH